MTMLKMRPRRMTGLALALSAMLLTSTPSRADPRPGQTPPDPPVKRADEIHPLRFRSFTTDVTDDRTQHLKDGYKQATVAWSEWWYYYESVEAIYIVGVGRLTITPVSPTFTNWSYLEDIDIQLRHWMEGCTYTASKPDENSPGLQLSAGITGTKDGPEIGGTAGWSVAVDGVTIESVKKTETTVDWEADIDDGSGSASGGVNALIYFADW